MMDEVVAFGIIDRIGTILVVIFLSASVSFYYSIMNQEWITSKHQQYVSVLLAPAVLVITWSISNNLALSLGMIGALSIVRFRNPVKSPSELSIYFIYIVIGVSAGVKLEYSIIIWGVALTAPIIVNAINYLLLLSGSSSKNNAKGYIGHFQVVETVENILEKIDLDLYAILSIHETTHDEKPTTHISILVKDHSDFQTAGKELKKCGKICSSSLQQSF